MCATALRSSNQSKVTFFAANLKSILSQLDDNKFAPHEKFAQVSVVFMISRILLKNTRNCLNKSLPTIAMTLKGISDKNSLAEQQLAAVQSEASRSLN